MNEREREHKKELANLDRIAKAIRMQVTFGKIKTFHDLLRVCGFDERTIKATYFVSELEKRVSFKDVNEYLSDRRIELTTRHWLENNPPIITHEEIKEEKQAKEMVSSDGGNTLENIKTNDVQSSSIIPTSNTNATVIGQVEDRSVPISKPTPDTKEHELEAEFETSPNESKDAFFFWFQKRAIVRLLRNILGDTE